MSKVVNIHDGSGFTTQDINPDVIFENMKGEMQSIFYAGYTKDGEFVTGSSVSDIPMIYWMIELAKKRMLEIGDE